MRWLTRWAVRLYPAAWRARYGDELDVLMEDAGPRWTDSARHGARAGNGPPAANVNVDQPKSGNLEVIEPASLPSSPNRVQMAAFGLFGGMLLGLATSRFRRTPLATA